MGNATGRACTGGFGGEEEEDGKRRKSPYDYHMNRSREDARAFHEAHYNDAMYDSDSGDEGGSAAAGGNSGGGAAAFPRPRVAGRTSDMEPALDLPCMDAAPVRGDSNASSASGGGGGGGDAFAGGADAGADAGGGERGEEREGPSPEMLARMRRRRFSSTLPELRDLNPEVGAEVQATAAAIAAGKRPMRPLRRRASVQLGAPLTGGATGMDAAAAAAAATAAHAAAATSTPERSSSRPHNPLALPPATPRPKLPPGWVMASTPEGYYYYWNESLQTSSWTVPGAE